MATRSINDLYNLSLYIVRKERGTFLKIADFNANMDAGQMEVFEEFFKGYGANQEIHDAIRQFRVYKPYTSDSAGFVTYPSDYLHLIGQPFTVSGSTVNRIEFLNEDEVPFAFTSQLRPITNSYPIGVDTSIGFSIYPQQTQVGAYWYLRRPANPTLVVTTVNRTVTYDSVNSVQLEWNDAYVNLILATALKFAGVNMDEKGISDFAMQFEKEN